MGVERNQNVLLLERVAGHSKALTRLLEFAGFEVTTTAQGVEALELVVRGRFVLVLADSQTPDFDLNVQQKLHRIDPLVSVVVHTSADRPMATGPRGANDPPGPCSTTYLESSDPESLLPHIHNAVRQHLTRYATELEHRLEARGESLRQSEERFRLLVEHTPCCLHELDLNGRLTGMNPAGLRMLGLQDESQIQGVSYLDFVSDEDKERVRTYLHKATQGESSHFEFTAMGLEPASLFESCFIPICSRGGSIEGLIGVSGDVTEERRTQQALVDSEARYQDLYDNAPEIFVSFEPKEGRVMSCNESLVRLTGRSKDEILGDPVIQLYHPDCHAEYRQALRDFAETGEVHDVELLLKNRDGTVAEVVLNASAVRNEAGEILHSRSVLHDVTERNRAERELRELNMAVENSMTGVSRLDERGRYIAVRKMYSQMLGYDSSELVGQSWEATVHVEDREQVRQCVARLGNEGRTETTVRGIRKDGSQLFKRILMVKAAQRYGLPAGHYCFMQDVTEQVESDRALRDAEERLRHSQKIESLGRVTGELLTTSTICSPSSVVIVPCFNSLSILTTSGGRGSSTLVRPEIGPPN